ncbi:MAG: hypothetical protein A3B10_00900 [Candidatus Doudnabacteria bacterium RIFCSPLOWO2_01_FULL_44_21]|uniref:Uncharacterized protein n=1 Tax=Candidatus Doudnabacteria bacterium RIFCSPLOWO2_01_FULL_44_21 TaxID=1817841 RepID=A0A1F5PWS6_9BACT|nr:MAG: hypothetical protein A3B95_03810 [Candidatus Doudnabacteria bacterium RIFCSPHIGHO2_02_FULL_43_13b]OGE94349.1 MAG: hypothetical protein A3B10_00900 [Candidatus Doudnabacteria bacterium RIFCSPLOWO2_01_FULL_44_21]
MKFLKNISILAIIVFFTFLISYFWFQSIYSFVFNDVPDGFFEAYEAFSAFIVVFIYVFVLFTSLFFTAFGDQNKYWWMGILLIPAALFELYFDWQHIYIPIILGLIGWMIGYGISKLMNKPKAAR